MFIMSSCPLLIINRPVRIRPKTEIQFRTDGKLADYRRCQSIQRQPDWDWLTDYPCRLWAPTPLQTPRAL